MNEKLKVLINTPVSLVKGLRVTITNMIRTKTTVAYPEVMPVPAGQGQVADASDAFERPYELSPRFRGLHGLTKDDTGDLNCIGCMACAKVCPDDLISMTLEKREGHSGRFPVTFTVNIGPCCFCGLCAEVCPTPHRAIVMTDLFEWASYRRDGANLILRREDLEKHGEYEMQRRLSGRKFDDEGRLIGMNPEEEGNPYFQLKPEYEAVRQGKSLLEVQQDEPKPEKAEKADKPAKETKAEAAAPAVDPMVAVNEAFNAAGVDVPSDLMGFDLASLDSIEDRKLRAQCKSAVMKARKAAEAGDAPTPQAEAKPAAAAAEDPFAVLKSVFEAAGQPVPADVQAFDLASLDAIEDRKLRGQLKSAVMKARKAGVEAPPAEAAEAAPAAAKVEPAAAEAPAVEEPAGEAGDAERAALVEVLKTAGVDVPDAPESLALDDLDGIEDRKLRGQAKSALRKLQRALGLVD